MPKILDSNAYREMEKDLNNLFEQIYKHGKMTEPRLHLCLMTSPGS